MVMFCLYWDVQGVESDLALGFKVFRDDEHNGESDLLIASLQKVQTAPKSPKA